MCLDSVVATTTDPKELDSLPTSAWLASHSAGGQFLVLENHKLLLEEKRVFA